MQSKSDLPEIISALRAPSGFAGLLNGWQEQCDQDCNDSVPRPGPLFILIPQQDLTALRRSAILPPLVVAIPTLALALIEDVQELLRPQCLHWRTQLIVRLDAAVCRHISIRSPSSIRGALLNLVLNAVQAAGTGGSVEIHVANNGQELTVDIRDDGPGFDRQPNSLTEAFQSTKPQGIGLGLTIAQHAVQRQGGRLTIQRDGNQTSVMISIPQHVIEQCRELIA